MSLRMKFATGLGALLLAGSVIAGSPLAASATSGGMSNVGVMQASGVGSAPTEISTQANTTTSIYISKAEVRRMYEGMKAAGSLCSVSPIPWPLSISCAGLAPARAIEQAYWQDKRVRVDYTTCGFNYCSSTSFHVVD